MRVPRRGRGRPRRNPIRLIADKAYDSTALRARLKARGIELIAPHLKNRRNKVQDGRPLRRYVRRWKVERAIAWLQNFRRLVTRYERSLTAFRGFFHVALMMVALRRL